MLDWKKCLILLFLGCFFLPFITSAQTSDEIERCRSGINATPLAIVPTIQVIRNRISALRISGSTIINAALTNGADKARQAQIKADLATNLIAAGNTSLARTRINEASALLKEGYGSYSQALEKYDQSYETINRFCTYRGGSLIVGLDAAESNDFFTRADSYKTSINNLKGRLDSAAAALPDRPFGLFEALLPGITERTIDQFDTGSGGKPILRYFSIVMNIIIATIVAIGLISIVVAGYLYVTAGGDSQKVVVAKSLIGAALLGIVLALAAFLILNTIGTQFASGLREPSLTP